jgi:rod shape-determining protein MreD
MKSVLLYLGIGLAVIVAQTTVLRPSVCHGLLYDLLIPCVVFLSLNQTAKRGLPVILGLGLVMDAVSGGIFGVYVSVYFWIFLLSRGLYRYFQIGNTISQALLIGLCVLGQQLILWSAAEPVGQGIPYLVSQARPVLLQPLLAALTGPAVLLILRKMNDRVSVPSPGAEESD